MTNPTNGPVILDAVRQQYQKAEEEIRQAAEALKRLGTAAERLDAARATIMQLHDAVLEDGRVLQGAVETLQRCAATLDSATADLARAEPARLAEAVASAAANTERHLSLTAEAIREFGARSESWQQQVLLTLGQVAGQIRQDVRTEIATALGPIQKDVERTALATERGIAAVQNSVAEVRAHVVGAEQQDERRLAAAVAELAGLIAKSDEGARTRSAMIAKDMAERMDAMRAQTLLEVRVIGGVLIVGVLVLLYLTRLGA